MSQMYVLFAEIVINGAGDGKNGGGMTLSFKMQKRVERRELPTTEAVGFLLHRGVQ